MHVCTDVCIYVPMYVCTDVFECMNVPVQRLRHGGGRSVVRVGVLPLAHLHRTPHLHHGSRTPLAARIYGGYIGAPLGQHQVSWIDGWMDAFYY